MFRNNEVFEGFKDREIFKIPHGFKEKPIQINTLVEGVKIPYSIYYNNRNIYLTFIKSPNKRFIFSWE